MACEDVEMGTGSERWKVSPTVALTASCLALLAGVVIVSQNIQTDRPTTLDGVTAEVLVDVDSISATLPAGIVTSSVGDSDVFACPDGRGGQQVTVSRTLAVRPDFETAVWIADVSGMKTRAGTWGCAPWAAETTSSSSSSANASSSTALPSPSGRASPR